MNRLPFVILICIMPTPLTAACPADIDTLGADYSITVATADAGRASQNELTLWRDGRRALHVHPDRTQSELWEHTITDRIRLVRLFDEYARGIEYQPGEIGSSSNSDSWQMKRQLLAPSALQADRLQSRSGEGCEEIQTYAWEEAGAGFQVEWLPAWQLVAAYSMTSPERRENWKLERRITEVERVHEAFARVDAYSMTDFADIGDSESDPFLRQMIRLGVIEHPHGPHEALE